jgi:hypothetical protein
MIACKLDPVKARVSTDVLSGSLEVRFVFMLKLLHQVMLGTCKVLRAHAANEKPTREKILKGVEKATDSSWQELVRFELDVLRVIGWCLTVLVWYLLPT